MKRALIGCKIIQKEIEEAIQKTNAALDTFWLDEDYHNHPDKLHAELQKNIDMLNGYDEILLSFGLCGNALIGITATHCDIYYPKIDDCICGFLSNHDTLNKLRKDSVFVSRGWLTTRNSFANEYNRASARYGEDRAESIYKKLYANYKNVIYMKTEQNIPKDLMDKAKDMATRLDLSFKIEPADYEVYIKLLNEQDHPLIRKLPKGSTITHKDFSGEKGEARCTE